MICCTGECAPQLAPDDPHKLLSAASTLLSDLTHFAGLVKPTIRNTVFRQGELINLAEKRVLLIIVSQEGEVENRVLLTDKPYSQSQLVESANYFNRHFAGRSFDQVRMALKDELGRMRDDMQALMTAAVNAGSEALEGQRETVVVSGSRNLLNVEDLSANMQNLRRLFDAFEQKTSLLALLEQSRNAQGV